MGHQSWHRSRLPNNTVTDEPKYEQGHNKMLETAVNRPLAEEPAKAKAKAQKGTRMRDSSAVRGYALLLLFITVGWLLRDLQLYTPAEGVGYWLGIIGGSLMLALLLSPLRKRIRFCTSSARQSIGSGCTWSWDSSGRC